MEPKENQRIMLTKQLLQNALLKLLKTVPLHAISIRELCKEAGLVVTPAGAMFPYGIDPDDSKLRIAPTFPSCDELEIAADLLTVCARLAIAEKYGDR